MTPKRINHYLALPILACFCAAAGAQPTEFANERLPDDEPSGWLKIELAIVIDAQASTLESERWNPFPEARYPLTYRWLENPEHVALLGDTYPEADISSDTMGNIRLAFPDPETLIAADREARRAAELLENASLMAATESIIDDNIDAGIETDQLALELLDTKPTDLDTDTDALTALGEETVAPNELVGLKTGADGTDIDNMEQEIIPPPALPAAFQRRPLEDLSLGIQSLLRETGDALEVDVAWVQAPDAANVPIVIDSSGDSADWPQLQGFVELRRGQEIRLGVNLWWNTSGDYLPDGFTMPSPPRGPTQLTRVDAQTGMQIDAAEIKARQEQLAAYEQEKLLARSVEAKEGFPSVHNNEPEDSQEPQAELIDTSWPWRHFIHITDTKALAEGAVRYFDHPVIKVFSTYRELTWGEVYTLGIEDAGQTDLDAEQANNETTGPAASVIPPDQQPWE